MEWFTLDWNDSFPILNNLLPKQIHYSVDLLKFEPLTPGGLVRAR